MLKRKRFILIYILFFGALHPLLAQRNVISESQADSIRKVINQNSSSDHSKGFNQLSGYFFKFNVDSAKVLAEKALHEAKKHKNSKELGFAYKNLGSYYQSSTNFDSAFYYYIKAEKHFADAGEKQGLLSIYNNLSLMHKNMNQLDLAMNYLMKMKKLISSMEATPSTKTALYSNLAGIFYLQGQTDLGMQYLDSASQYINQLEDIYVKGIVYNNLGKLFYKIERYDKSLSMLQRSLSIFEKLEDTAALAMSYENLGEVYEKIYNYQRAESFYQKAYDIHKAQDNSLGIASLKKHLGELLTLRKEFKAGREHLTEAYEVYKKNNDTPGMAEVVNSIAVSYQQEGNNSKAIAYLQDHQKEVSNANRRALLRDYFKTSMEAYQALNRYPEALEASEKYYQMRDSIQSDHYEANVSILKQEIKLSKDLVQEQAALNEEKINQKKSLSLIWLYIAIALMVASGLLTYFFIRKEKQKAEGLKHQLAEKEKEITSLNKQANDFNKKVEEMVAQRTLDYENQIQQLKKKDNKLKKTLKEVEDANYLKNAFLSNMSHEIRTPLNGIIGFASLLETELSLIENEELYSYANGIQQSGERLLHLLNNIIDISRIEANDLQVSLQETNMNQIIEKSSELFKFQANEKNLALNIRLQETPMIYADPDSVSKILSDVIDNAVKYTEKGFINVTNGYLTDKKEVFVKVRDTGIGIDENYLPKVFEAFRQESLGYSRAFQGAGLGLPLAKRLLDLLNGRIDIESKKQQGTTVSIYLPTKETFKHVDESLHPDRKKGKEPIPLKKSIEDTHLFLVEDDRMNRLVITKMLTDWKLESAEDGDITIEKIAKAYKKGHIFDLMLFDINLPNPWDGIKLMHYIKKKFPEYADIPFIAQTAYAMRGDKERLLEEGFDDYLSKPISQQRLLTSIYKFLRKEHEE